MDDTPPLVPAPAPADPPLAPPVQIPLNPVWLGQVLLEEYRAIGLLTPEQAAGFAGDLPGIDDLRLSIQTARTAIRAAGGDPDTDPDVARDVQRLDQSKRSFLLRLYRTVDQHPAGPAALCLSGGGIRSATFALGVIQRLARENLLAKFHYLSTVSGGGYIGSWLSSWVSRAGGDARAVQDQLRADPTPVDPEPPQVRHLREYSNYLSPRLGVFSVDTWTLAATFVRNLTLNWLVTLTLLAAVLVLPRLGALSVRGLQIDDKGWTTFAAIACTIAAALCQAVAVSYMDRHRPSARAKYGLTAPDTQGKFLWGCWLWLVLAAVLLATAWTWFRGLVNPDVQAAGRWGRAASEWTFWLFAILAFSLAAAVIAYGINLARMTPGHRRARRTPEERLYGIYLAVAGAVSSLVLYLFLRQEWLDPYQHPRAYVAAAPAAYLLSFLVGGIVFRGLTSRITRDPDREWSARAAAWILLTAVGWAAAAAIVLLAPSWLMSLSAKAQAAVTAVGGLAAAVTAVLGKSSKTPGNAEHGGPTGFGGTLRQHALTVAAPLFVLFLITAISLATTALISRFPGNDRLQYEAWRGSPPAFAGDHAAAAVPLNVVLWPGDSPHHVLPALTHRFPPVARVDAWAFPRDWHRDVVLYGGWLPPLAVLLGGLAVGLTMSYYVSVNKFSLHTTYRNRLIRCYLGASRTDRDRSPTLNRFTGFDKHDDLRVHELLAPQAAERGDARLFHVINMTLNLVGGEKLAWQERKADGFTATPLHCGNADLGYRRSTCYGGGATFDLNGNVQEHRPHRAVSVGTALAVSGAAANPNMGYHSSPAVAFLMTLFNVRLGAWLGNPGWPGSHGQAPRLRVPFLRTFRVPYLPTFGLAHPRSSARPLIAEAFGLTDSRHPYVHLSDGGHFENLGLYEMVRRRCKLIVVCDAGADPDCAFDDLGNAVRKIHIDLGVEIAFTGPLPMRPRKDKFRPRAGRGHHAVGKIYYAPREPRPDHETDEQRAAREQREAATTGTLIYIKAAFYGTDEPAHVYNYAQSCRDFPHQSTADQFFSESQFESYRALGYYSADLALPDLRKRLPAPGAPT
jgi:hypothetical protein